MNRQDLTQEQIETIIFNYTVLKKGLVSSGKAAGVSQRVVEKVLKEYGIKKRTYTEAKQLLRAYSLNDNYFKIQSPNMAYILGFIAADGCVSSKENKVSIMLKDIDQDILQQIKEETENSREIKFQEKNNQKYCSLIACSAEWKKDLSVYNIIPKKTFNLKPPLFLDRKYWIYYIKGFFDGDGSIYEANGTLGWKIGCCCKEIVDWMREFLVTDYGIYCNKIYYQNTVSNNGFWNLTYYGDNARKIFKLFYEEEKTIQLNRKYLRYKELYNKYYHETTSP